MENLLSLKKVKSKKNKLIAISFTFISLVLSWIFIVKDINIIDDAYFHLARIQALSINIRNGELLPTISSYGMNNYGYPYSIFYPDLFLYIPAILMLLGFSLSKSYGIFMFIISMATCYTMYYSVKNILRIYKIKKDDLEISKLSTLAAIIYLLFPYRLITLYFRNALGEILAMVFIPLVICGVLEIVKSDRKKYYILSIGMSGLMFSHILSLYIMTIFILIMFLLNINKNILEIKDIFISFAKATILTIGITSIYLFPIIEQMLSNIFYYNKYALQGYIYNNSIKIIEPLKEYKLIILNVLILIIIYKVIKMSKSLFLKYALLTIYIFIVATNLFPWEIMSTIPLMPMIQFPWRLLSLMGFTTTMAIILALRKKSINNKIIIRICGIFCIYLGVVFLGIKCIPINAEKNETYYNNLKQWGSVGAGEYLPYGFKLKYIQENNMAILDINNNPIEITNEKLYNNSIEFQYNSKSEKPIKIEVPKIYYKGYKAYINDNKVNIEESKNGLILVDTNGISSGKVVVTYKHTVIQYIAYIITFITILYLFFRKKITSLK